MVGCFGIVLGGDSVVCKKFDLLLMLMVCDVFGVVLDVVVVIGDLENDVLVGCVVGMVMLMVLYGYNYGKVI